MAGSGDELAAGTGDRSLMRVSDAEREQAVAVLKAAFVQGRLTQDEFASRVARAFASRTYGDLEALTADIPAMPAKAPPPEPARQPNSKQLIQRGTAVGAAAGFVIPAVVATAVNGDPVVGVIAGALLSVFITVLLAGFLTLLSWVFERDSGRQAAQGPPPGAHGKAYQPPASAGPAGSPAQLSQEPPHAAEAGRGRGRRPRLRLRAPYAAAVSRS